ncbi:MAG: sugar ABC transporter permease [Synergistaceae bacterium]|nr:sugar ABC transporter permease [Synergistaceae bacterium]
MNLIEKPFNSAASVTLPRFRRMSRVHGESLAGKFAKGATPYMMVAPAVLQLSVFVVYPILYMLWLSMFRWDMIGPKVFVGLQNFAELFSNPDFFQVMGNTFTFMFFSVSISIVLALALALHLRADTRINALLQSFVFVPYITSLVSVAFIWMWLMDSDYGLLNFFLASLGLPAMRWLDDPRIAMSSMVLVAVWKGIGYNTIILVSAMQAIPGHLYEAAALDKSNPAKTFFRITLPMISPTLFFLTLMNIIAAFKVFEQINVMTSGGPMNTTNTLVFDIYQYGFKFYKLGYASAQGVILMAIIGICTLFYFGALNRRVHYSGGGD